MPIKCHNGPRYGRNVIRSAMEHVLQKFISLKFIHHAPWLLQLQLSKCENSVLAPVSKIWSLINPRLVTGSAIGSIGPLFDKMLAIQNKHGPFDLALCIGDFFGPLSGDKGSDDVVRLLGGELRGSS